MTYLTKNGGYSHRMYQFAFNNKALPIVTYISGAEGIQFPAEKRAVQMLDWLTEKVRNEQEELDIEVEQPVSSEQLTANSGNNALCESASSCMDEILRRLALPNGEYCQKVNLKSADGKFQYTHIARENKPVWDIKHCMLKLRTYNSRVPLTTRVEFGFSQDKVKLKDFQKDYLRCLFHQYAKLHGLMEYRRFTDKQFYNVYVDFEGDPEEVVCQTVHFFNKFLKVAESFIDSIHKCEEGS